MGYYGVEHAQTSKLSDLESDAMTLDKIVGEINWTQVYYGIVARLSEKTLRRWRYIDCGQR